MSKEITKAIILQQLQDRLALREFDPTKFLFDETVVPVYEISGLLRIPTVEYAEKSVTSGPIGILFFTVPEDEQWTLHRYNVVFMGAGAYTVTGLFWHKQGESTKSMYLDMTLGQTASYIIELRNPVQLPPGSSLRLYIDSYTSTQDLRLYIEYIKETIR